jgi:hypothetical protein
MRRKPSSGTVIAILALVVALGGTAIAADRYIITSTSQIKPSVLRELRADASAAKVAAKGANAVVARARFSGAIASESKPSEAIVPLSGATWTQSAEEVDHLVAGGITMTVPTNTECTHGKGEAASGYAGIYLGGQLIAGAGAETTEREPRTETIQPSFTISLRPPDWLYEPGTTTKHTLEARATDSCEGGTRHFTVDSVSFDVVGVR